MDTIPREVVSIILFVCDFDSWRRARFVCHAWAKICAENDWKINEFVKYREKPEDVYGQYLPNGIAHGVQYTYERIGKTFKFMNSISNYSYGKEIFIVDFCIILNFTPTIYTAEIHGISFYGGLLEIDMTTRQVIIRGTRCGDYEIFPL